MEKKDITFKIIENDFYVKAIKEDIGHADRYIFCCPVSPEKAGANYPKSIFKVKVTYQQAFEKAVGIKTD